MPEISNKKKKFIKRNFKRLSIEELSYKAGLKPNIVRSLVDEYNAKMPGKDRDSLELINGNSILTKRSVKMTGMVAVTIFLIAFMVLYTVPSK